MGDVVQREAGEALVLDLDGFEGPIDLLLALAREQKVDLTRISILALATQYLEFIARRRALRLEIAADYLVMAAWLAYLKSRLLLPPAERQDEEPSPEAMAASLAAQLRRAEAIQAAAARLRARPKLGEDVFARGMPEGVEIVGRITYVTSLAEFLAAYPRRVRERPTLTIVPTGLHSIEAALRRLEGLLGRMPEWQTLQYFLPPGLEGLVARSAIASTLVAALELARCGRARLRQERPFGPVYVRKTGPTADA